MEQIKNNIYSILCIAVLIFTVIGCASNSLAERNYFINSTEFYNDTLDLTGTFLGDIDYYKIQDINKHDLKKDIKGFRRKNLLLYGEALTGYKLYLFYEKNRKNNEEDSKLILHSSDRVAYQKINQEAILTLLLIKNEEKGISTSQNALINNGKKIMDNLKYNDSIKEKLKYNQVIYKNKDISNILYIVDKLDKAPISISKMNRWDKFQMLLTMLSNDPTGKRYIEMYNEYITNKRRRNGKKIDSLLSEVPYSSNEEILDKIKFLAKENKALMLNECHWCPSNRIMALKLLEPLKEEGYNYFAIEAVSEGEDNTINQKLYPLKSSGFYIKEPYFGLLIREAKKLGFQIVGYDYGFNDSPKDRDRIQAENIANIFKEDTNAKVFVYAGIDHIIEMNNSRKWMAEYFKEITKIDPITIDQVEIASETNKKNSTF